MAFQVFGGRKAAVRVLAAALLCCGLASWTTDVAAEGAVALAIPPNVAASGFAEGHSHDRATPEEAAAAALDACRKQGAPANTPCVVVMHFRDQCLSVAFDPKAGTPGWGWAVAPTSAESNARAMAQCSATAGADRQGFCALGNGACDGSAR